MAREVRRRVARRLEKERKRGQTVKVNFDIELADMDGEPIVVKSGTAEIAEAMVAAGIPKGEVEKVMPAINRLRNEADAESNILTAKEVARQALGALDQEASGSDRLDRIELAMRITESENGEVEISNKERDLILERVRVTYPAPIIYFRMDRAMKAGAS